MATSIAAPNLHRAALLEFEFSYDSEGIISVIDDLVERVMSAHMKKALPIPSPSMYFSEQDAVAFPSCLDLVSESESADAAA